MNKNNSIRTILSAALLIVASTTAFAQGNGLAGINEATSMVTSYFDPGTKLIYAIGAVVGLIGGVKVYGKFVRRATPTPPRQPPHGSERVSSSSWQPPSCARSSFNI